MRRFLLTSERFKGSAEVWYNFDDMLCRIDLLCADMNYEQIKYLVSNISPDAASFRACMPSQLEITELPFEIPTAEDFLREYGYNRNTHLVKAQWPQLDKKVKLLALIKAIEYRNYCRRNEHWYKPMIPDTWLRKKQYLNNWNIA